MTHRVHRKMYSLRYRPLLAGRKFILYFQAHLQNAAKLIYSCNWFKNETGPIYGRRGRTSCNLCVDRITVPGPLNDWVCSVENTCDPCKSCTSYL